jgi:L-asparaginase
VVTQGTDPIEETAYYLDLHHRRDEPLVVTGAMRNPTLAGADGPANLLAAIQTAADLAARQRGCLVVFADEIHAAARVRKTHATSLTTFQSPVGGPLGYVVEGRPRFVAEAADRVVVGKATPGTGTTPRVALVTTTLGDDESVLDGIAERCDGLVVAGFGVGHVPEAMVEPLEALAAQMPVVLASRTGAGPVLARTYGFPGSESDLQARRLIPAGFLHPYKARVLLYALLAAGRSRAEVSAAFALASGT